MLFDHLLVLYQIHKLNKLLKLLVRLVKLENILILLCLVQFLNPFVRLVNPVKNQQVIKKHVNLYVNKKVNSLNVPVDFVRKEL